MQYVEIKKPWAVVRVDGELINTVLLQLQAELETAFQNGCTQVCFDLLQTTDIESAGISGMIKIRKKVGKENFAVINPNRELTETFAAAALDGWIRSDIN